ncbi:MAG: ATP-dependent zinc metalloprotease FtsH [bacterium]|nr:ATP-dependent metallopeptidase FtsH/Yme1/Tma family protein [Bacillota bacterium]
MNRAFRNMSFYLLLIIIALSVINYYANEPAQVEEIAYSDFLEHLEAGEVDRVTIVDGSIEGEFKNGEKFTTYNPNDGKLIERLEEAGVTYTGEPPPSPPWWTTLLSTLFPIILLIGVWIFIMQQTQGGGNRVMSFGKSRARLYSPDDKTKVTFADVAGADEAKEELAEIVEFLKEPKKFIELGARIPKGVLLVGPPGTGKTLLARAVAGEAGVPFFTISGSDFVEMFVGVGASRVRDLFDQAKRNAPCLVFIDEIDAVGRQRGAGLGGGHDEREQTLNQLLVEMDGFGANEGVIILAATNRPDVLDPALLRPGRFDRQVIIDQPDVVGREAILKVHVRGKPLDGSVDLEVLARRTPGFTGADLANMVNEAAILTARRNKRRIGMEEMEEAIDRVIAGPERKSRVISERERRLVAYHEAGHAVLGHVLPHTDPVHKVSIIPRGRAGGYTLSLPKEDRYYMTRSELLDRITQLLGGRVAEELVLNEISTGAQNDLERATALVRKMIMEYGMSEKLGPLTFGHKQEQVFLGRDIARDRNYSEEVASAIDQEVRRIIDECYDKATRLLKENRDKLDLLAQTLLEQETLHADELERLLMEGEAAPEAEVEEAEGDTGPVTDGEVPAYRPRRESQPLFRKPQEGLS